MDPTKLQFIRVSDEQVVVRRGLNELLLTGAGAVSLAEHVVHLLNLSQQPDEVVAAFPEPAAGQVERLLDALRVRGMLSTPSAAAPSDGDGQASLQQAFFASLGAPTDRAARALAQSTVSVHGDNLIARTLVAHLRAIGIAQVTVTSHPVLDNAVVPDIWFDGSEKGAPDPSAQPSLIVGTCDFGRADALLELNRAAVEAGTPYLPAWLEGLTGHVGPLTVPREAACLRCFTLRRESNDPHPDVSAALHHHATTTDDGRGSVGLLPPMPAVVGSIAAMEAVKFLTGVVPSDATARALEINLVSFAATARRVLKVPRCPDCSDVARTGMPAALVGPQISTRWARLHT